MRCPTCGTENLEHAKFCSKCGRQLGEACPRCGAQNLLDARFCARCGTFIAGKGRLEESADLGERKLVTILFAEMEESLALLMGRDPEPADAILTRMIEAMKDAVHRFEGTVNRVLVDGIMALFGAPLAHEDHALRACYAALAMREQVARVSEEIKQSHGIDMRIRIGINSGEVVVHTVSTDISTGYDATGEAVHIAARMEQTAAPGTIRLAAQTMPLVRRLVIAKALGPIAIRGLSKPLEVFELLRAAEAKAHLQFGYDRELTAFANRTAEAAALGRAAERVRAGQGRVIALVGEPGAGKSRLVYEFLSSREVEGWSILEARALPYTGGISYFPVIELLKSYFGLEDGDNAEAIRGKLARRLAMLGDPLENELSIFLTLYDAPVDGGEWASLGPVERRRRILDAVRKLLVRESQDQPLVVVFEDLHWIDTETEICLDRLVDALSSARILLLVTYRPEYTHGWVSKPHYAQHRLEPLAARDASEMFRSLTGTAGASIESLVIERTQGNPFFLEETVNALVDEAVLVGDRGDYRLAKPLGTVQVPSTVRALLAARIDRLAPDAKRVLQAAAVIGKDVPFAVLRAIDDQPEADLLRVLTQLQEAEFIYETEALPDLEYTFRHALIHEVSYRSILLERRRQIHARIVAAVEGLHADRLTEQAERLAHHSLQAELWREAARYCRQAGAKATARSADRKAIGFFEQALGALDRLPPSEETQGAAIDVRFDLRTPLFRLGELGRELENLREAEREATKLGDRARLVLLFIYLSHIFWLVGEQDRALEDTDRIAALAGDDDFALGVRGTFQRGLSHFALCDYPRTIAAMRHTLEHVDSPAARGKYGLDAALGVVCLSYLARSFAETGDFAEGRAVADRSLRLAEQVDKPFYLIFARLGMGYLEECIGNHAEAIPWLEGALELSRRFEATLLLPAAASFLGLARLHAGDIGSAMPLLREGVETADQIGLRFQQGLRLAALAEGYLVEGKSEAATRCATRAHELSLAQRERGAGAYAGKILGAIAAATPAAESAEGRYRAAAALAQELGMRPLLAHCWRERGLLASTAHPSEAEAALRRALALYRELDMPSWAVRATRDLAALAARPSN